MERKYIPIIFGFVFSISIFIMIIVLTLNGIMSPAYVLDFISVIPGKILTDLIIVYLLPIGFFLLFYLIAPYLIPAYIKIHKFCYWIIRRPSKYGVAKLGTKVTAGRIFFRFMIVSLFSFIITVLIVQLGYGGLFRFEYAITSLGKALIYQVEAIFLGSFLFCSVLIILFFPIWLLEDSGLVSYRVFKKERMPIDIQGVHSLFNNLILGYAGLTTFLTLLGYIIRTISLASYVSTEPFLVVVPILLISLPFMIIGVIAIPVYLYERYSSKNQARLKEKLASFNFPNIKVPSFDEMEE